MELSDSLVADFDVVDRLTLLADRCAENLDVAAAGIMLADDSDAALRVVAASSEDVRVVELLGQQTAEGPCFDCYGTGEPVPHQKLADALARWPRFAPEAIKAGFTAVQALPMRRRDDVIGALSLFQTGSGDGLTPEASELAQSFADAATIGILQDRASREAHVVNEQLSHALSSRIVIEQAKGVVAERLGLDMVASFGRLRTYARNNNLRIGDVARGVIDGTIDTSSLQAGR